MQLKSDFRCEISWARWQRGSQKSSHMLCSHMCKLTWCGRKSTQICYKKLSITIHRLKKPTDKLNKWNIVLFLNLQALIFLEILLSAYALDATIALCYCEMRVGNISSVSCTCHIMGFNHISCTWIIKHSSKLTCLPLTSRNKRTWHVWFFFNLPWAITQCCCTCGHIRGVYGIFIPDCTLVSWQQHKSQQCFKQQHMQLWNAQGASCCE